MLHMYTSVTLTWVYILEGRDHVLGTSLSWSGLTWQALDELLLRWILRLYIDPLKE